MFDLLDCLSVTGGEVANALFHARGAAVNHNTDLWGHATPVGMHREGSAVYGWWPMAYGWLSGHLFEHYIYTGDQAFLEQRALPVLRKAAQFFIDTVRADENGYLTLRPATSPENRYVLDGQRVAVASATTMTDEIIREVLGNYLTALSHLGLHEPDEDAARHVLAHTPPYRIGQDGRLLEWDADYEEVDPQHRHLSPLCGLFPGHLISEDSDPRLLAAVRAMLDRRGNGGTGWSLGWKVNIWARLRDGDHALSLLRRQLHAVDPCAQRRRLLHQPALRPSALPVRRQFRCGLRRAAAAGGQRAGRNHPPARAALLLAKCGCPGPSGCQRLHG